MNTHIKLARVRHWPATAGLLVIACLLTSTAQAQRPSIAGLQAQITAQQAQINSGTIPNVSGYVTMDLSTPSRPTLRVEGANVQVVNGAGNTTSVNGVGNLIIGYNETSATAVSICSDGTYNSAPGCFLHGLWGANQHSGSHNLVIGSGHSYTSYSGMISGFENVINRAGASVTGGTANIASGLYAGVSGGFDNTASGNYAGVSGGQSNLASGSFASVSGGASNTASLDRASVSGGFNNTASGIYSSVSGGNTRSATGIYDWVAGTLLETQ